MTYQVVSRELLDDIFKNNDTIIFRNLLKSKLYDYDIANIVNYCSKYNNLNLCDDLCDILFDELQNMNPNLSSHALNVCLETSNINLIQRVIDQHPMNCEQYSKLFIQACWRGTSETLALFLNYGADINHDHGYAFVRACASGCEDVCKFLLDNGLIIDYSNPNIIKGIEIVMKKRNMKIIILLLQYGFDFSILNNMNCESNKNDTDIINILIEHNVKIINIVKLLSNK
ncbi:putative ankyrin repeat protein [Megavirus courdo11]|uniref:Ankyrin repeat protein n=3 Tax=Megamimivirinae TaxID=3044648 RepID=A0A2L2DNW5_MIMIV|nr:putative ankyrin repeat protein [Megavirus chiliensis]AEQ32406.1 ankyrin repeat protein [Megavirus chiliensis]AFX93133.1 putative ankyrin repeat protein [Megavirus courdo11]AVG47865.1 ankyrin repeat protein [Acanthamoeba polyphaga mimivirus]